MSTILPHDWFDRSLPPDVEIGAGSWLYSSFAFLHASRRRTGRVSVGHDTGIYDGSFLELGPDAFVTIGNYCTLVGAIIRTNGRVIIGDHVLIAHEVVIADSDHAAPPGAPLAEPGLAGASVTIGRNAWICARAVLLDGARIGENSIVGAGCVVDFEVDPDCVVAGSPARITRRGRST